MFLNLGSSPEEEPMPLYPGSGPDGNSCRNSVFEDTMMSPRSGPGSIIGGMSVVGPACSNSVWLQRAISRRSVHTGYPILPGPSGLDDATSSHVIRLPPRVLGGCFRRSTARLSIYLFLLTGYILLGALGFDYMETPVEREQRNILRSYREEFLRDHPCVSDAKLEALIEVLLNFSNRGVSTLRNSTDLESNWSFGNSVFFVTTLLTTIGYGRIIPLSNVGKICSVAYALLGIPMTLIMFSGVVERLHIPSRRLLHLLHRNLQSKISYMKIKLLHLILVVISLLVFFIILPAAIFCNLEYDWTFVDGVYYCFISLTTIGLGDYVPAERCGPITKSYYKLASSFYLLFGLIYMLFTLRVFHEVPELNLGHYIYMSSDEMPDSYLLRCCCIWRHSKGSAIRERRNNNTSESPAPSIMRRHMIAAMAGNGGTAFSVELARCLDGRRAAEMHMRANHWAEEGDRGMDDIPGVDDNDEDFSDENNDGDYDGERGRERSGREYTQSIIDNSITTPHTSTSGVYTE